MPQFLDWLDNIGNATPSQWFCWTVAIVAGLYILIALIVQEKKLKSALSIFVLLCLWVIGAIAGIVAWGIDNVKSYREKRNRNS